MSGKKKQAKKKPQRAVDSFFERALDELEDSLVPYEGVMSLKCLDDDGDVCIVHLKTPDLATWEAIGMLISATDNHRARLTASFEADE